MGFLRVFCLAQKVTSAHEYVIDYMNFTASVSSVKQKDGPQTILHRCDWNEALIVRADRYGDACDGEHMAEWLMNSIGTFAGLTSSASGVLAGLPIPCLIACRDTNRYTPQPMWGRPLHRHA